VCNVNKEYSAHIEGIKKYGAKIILMINPNDDLDEILKKDIREFNDKIIDLAGNDDVSHAYTQLTEILEEQCQKFLKKEWEKIKEEANQLYHE